MKKIVFILSFVFVAGLTMSSYANTATFDDNITISIVEDVDDKKPCTKDCKGDCCKNKEKKAECKDAKAEKKCCSSAKSKECSKSAEKKADAKSTTSEKK